MFKKIITIIFATVVLATSVSATTNIFPEECNKKNVSFCKQEKADKKAEDIVINIVKIMFYFGGAIAVIMIMYAGFIYVTSSGSSDKITSAKNIIIFSVIGLIVMLLALVIVSYVESMIK